MLDSIHENYTYGRRVSVLSKHMASLIDPGSSILDVGCGDGQISELIAGGVDKSAIEGIDVMERSISSIKVTKYDGILFHSKITRSILAPLWMCCIMPTMPPK